MDEKSFENVVALHSANPQEISQYFRHELLSSGFSSEESGPIQVVLEACSSDVVGGVLALEIDEQNRPLSVDDSKFPQFTARLIDRACSGPIVLNLLEDFFHDERSGERPLEVIAFAELVDVNVRTVIDQYGVRWKIMPAVDVMKLSTSNWKRVASVSTSSKDMAAVDDINVGYLVARCLRAVAAATYGSFDTSDDEIKALWSLPILLCQTNLAVSQALVAISVLAQNIPTALRSNSAFLHMPCGTDVKIDVRLSAEHKGQDDVIFSLLQNKIRSQHSVLVAIAITIMTTVLMGAGFHVTADIDADQLDGDMTIIDGELARILWAQAAIISQSIAQDLHSSHNLEISDPPEFHVLARCITIYRVANWVARSDPSTLLVNDDRLLLAREEAVDILESHSFKDMGAFLGEEESSETEPSTENETQHTLPGTSTGVPPTSAKVLMQMNRTEFLHYGPGSSDLPLLNDDFISESGLVVCARRGVPIKPDTRRSIIIKKRSALWGRVSFVNDCFEGRPLVNVESVLRAIIPFQQLGVAGLSFAQFESQSQSGTRGSELANILLSGAYGADQALWALKKILYSGSGLRQEPTPSFLLPIQERVRDDGFSVTAVLGSDAVSAIEVIVDDRGRVILDYEGNLNPLELSLHNRAIRCTQIDSYTGGKVGTIANKVCIF